MDKDKLINELIRTKILWKENLDNLKWMWQHRRDVPWIKNIKSTCEVHEISLSTANNALEWGVKVKKALPTCFSIKRIPEYERMITACDEAEDWEESLAEEGEAAARNKLKEIADNYYLICRGTDLSDLETDIQYI